MKILLTNDDGYNATGINIVEKHLSKYGEVYVVAPTFHQSGASMSFSIGKGFTIKKYDDHHYSIDGSPCDVVLLALQILDVKFDLIVSGCNSGHNISYDSLYSGTIGASLEALNHFIPSIALSSDFGHFDIVEKHLDEVLSFVFDNNLISPAYALNINFPSKKFDEIKGIKIAQEVFKYDSFYTWDEDDGKHTDRSESFETEVEDSDIYLVHHGYVSIVPLRNSYYYNEIYEKLKYLNNK